VSAPARLYLSGLPAGAKTQANQTVARPPASGGVDGYGAKAPSDTAVSFGFEN